jgi:hypothetical protein
LTEILTAFRFDLLVDLFPVDGNRIRSFDSDAHLVASEVNHCENNL